MKRNANVKKSSNTGITLQLVSLRHRSMYRITTPTMATFFNDIENDKTFLWGAAHSMANAINGASNNVGHTRMFALIRYGRIETNKHCGLCMGRLKCRTGNCRTGKCRTGKRRTKKRAGETWRTTVAHIIKQYSRTLVYPSTCEMVLQNSVLHFSVLHFPKYWSCKFRSWFFRSSIFSAPLVSNSI